MDEAIVFAKPFCSLCGKPAMGTVEQMQGIAKLTKADAGGKVTFAYEGTTDVCWDTQRSVTRGREALLQCENGHEWWSEKEVKP